MTAIKFTKKLRAVVKRRLENFPESGAWLIEIDDPAIKEIYYGNFRIIYRFDGVRVYILRVFRATRLLKPEDLF